jgi:hypothetical protein
MLTVSFFEFFAGSVATTETVVSAAFVGMPENRPFLASNLSPAGSLPASLNVSGPPPGAQSIQMPSSHPTSQPTAP